MNSNILLTIAIPTFNRGGFLNDCLAQLLPQVIKAINLVEVNIYDNASSDNTTQIVGTFIEQGAPFNYFRNSENIGSDKNIAQCFNLAKGKYVLILGDDDLIIDRGLELLLVQLNKQVYGVICMKPYGYNDDFRMEYPCKFGSNKSYDNAGLFLAAAGPLITLISSCIINKDLLTNLDANDFCGENLVQVHLVIQAAIAAKQNLFISHYMIACKRNNSGGYDFAKVFVENFGNILDSYLCDNFTKFDVLAIERKFIVGYLPFHLTKQRLHQQLNTTYLYDRISKRYGHRFIFYLWIYPILKSPKWFGVFWGLISTLIGRCINGDFLRGVSFSLNKIRIKIRDIRKLSS